MTQNVGFSFTDIPHRHYLDQLIEEAVGRWVAMCKPILRNWTPEDVARLLAAGQQWPWNEGLSHSAFIRREFMAALDRDRARDAKSVLPDESNWSA